MSVKLYMDLISQPTRALYIFMKKTNIPFEKNIINLGKREHYREGYEKINRFRKVPVIIHNGFNLTESVAIVRYLTREFQVDDHWYPKDSRMQAKVDEYLEWQHLNTRYFCSLYFLTKVTKKSNPKTIAKCEAGMIDCLDSIENIWLNTSPFLVGNVITVADIFGACEIEQLRVCDFNPRIGRPRLSTWLDRVAAETSPFYEEAHSMINRFAEVLAKKSKL